MIRFDAPWALLLLLAVPLLAYGPIRAYKDTALRFSSTLHAAAAGVSVRQRLYFIPTLVRALALICLVIALARPQEGSERVRDVSKGIAIEMLVDRSGSMGTEMLFEHNRLNRLEVVKRVFNEFVAGNTRDLMGRPNDLIGLVTFARYAETVCPLTLGHAALPRFLEKIDLPKQENEDGTAIGDAIALAAARLKTAEEQLSRQRKAGEKPYDIKSRVIILLTDGQNNCGKRQPLEAAAMAKEWGIKIYTVGVGGNETGSVVQTPLGPYQMPGVAPLDESALKAISDATGGIYRRADDGDSLRSFYHEIDNLEKTEFDTDRFLDYREWFMPFAFAALALLILEAALSSTVFRRLP